MTKKIRGQITDSSSNAWFITSVVITITLIIILVWSLFHSYGVLREFERRELALERASGEFLLHKKSLEMSAHMAAVTGDLTWLDTYHVHLSNLNNSLKEIAELVQGEEAAQQELERIRVFLNISKEIEEEAFGHIGRGNKEKGETLLKQWTYTKTQLEFMDAAEDLTELLHYQVREKVAFERKVTQVLFVLIFAALLFLIVSWYISIKMWRANLRKREEKEAEVIEKNEELEEKDQKITDSLYYAQIIQKAILPDEKQLRELIRGHFVLWRPADIVGGDFYWCKKVNKGYYLAVIDCTGHGVPGALMTMMANSILDRVINSGTQDNPAQILKKLNMVVKDTLDQKKPDFKSLDKSDDGFDIGLCYIIPDENKLIFAGAGISLYYTKGEEMVRIKSDRQSIGYRRSKEDYEYTNHEIHSHEQWRFYIPSDGYEDQNGDAEKTCFGRKKLISLLNSIQNKDFQEQRKILEKELEEHMGDSNQRDDITVLGFSI